jgi:hypothetical protein
MRLLTLAVFSVALGCATYPPIPAEDPCASDKLVCTSYMSDPKITACGYTDTDDVARRERCPRSVGAESDAFIDVMPAMLRARLQASKGRPSRT